MGTPAQQWGVPGSFLAGRGPYLGLLCYSYFPDELYYIATSGAV